ncbi:MAG: ATP-binding protein [Armatimonadia bacterium]
MRARLQVNSFRTRIALLSLLVSGVALLAFAVPVWFLIGRLDLQRIDNEVRLRALPHLGWAPDNRHWGMLEDELRFTYGASSSNSSFILVRARDGSTIRQSQSWPKSLKTGAFPLPGDKESGMRLRQPPPPPERTNDRRPQPPPPPARLRQPEQYTWRDGLDSWRIAILGNEHVTVVIGVSLASHQSYLLMNGLALLAALPLAALLAAVGGWLLSEGALRPVRRLTETAESITAKGLDQRLAAAGEDVEFERLIRVFNAMLERLQQSFQQATRFSADAAHELKTPLTILQGELEQALQEAATGSRQQRVYSELLEEVQRLKTIIRKLLLLSLADAGQLELTTRPLDLSAAVLELREDTEVLAPRLTVESDVAPDVRVLADPELLGQVLHNLASNAIKYNRPGGTIRYQLQRKEETARLTVTNTGVGVPPEDLHKVFQRFYRANKARDRAVDGVGLGLSLAREIVRAHGGELALVSSRDDHTTFVLSLPAVSVPEANAHPQAQTPTP